MGFFVLHLFLACNAFLLPPLSLPQILPGRVSLSKPLQRMVSSGFSYSDGEQLLVSLQKPLGIVLEQDTPGPIVVVDMTRGGAAEGAGVHVGDVLLAVQNASVENADLDEVLAFIGNAPRVLNVRLLRKE